MVGLVCNSPLMLLLMHLNPSILPSMLLLVLMPILTNHLLALESSGRLNLAPRVQPLLLRDNLDHKACLFRMSTRVAIVSNPATRSMSKMKFSIRLMNSTSIIHPPNSYHLLTSMKSSWERFTEVKTRLNGLTLWENVSSTSASYHWHTCNISLFLILCEERMASAKTFTLSHFSCLWFGSGYTPSSLSGSHLMSH